MVYEYQYNIANVALAIRSSLPLSAPPSLELFADQRGNYLDFIYYCRMQPQLPKLPESQNVRYYYDHVKKLYYAVTEESEGYMTVYLSEENLPWSTEIQQMYTQLAFPHVLLLHQKLLLHASYILTPEGAILFTAPSGTGKSTQAELWKKYRNALIVNGDRGVVGLENGIPTAYGYPISGSSEYCYNTCAKLRAIIALKQSPNNSVRRLNGTQQLRVLINGSYLPPEYSTDLPAVIDTAMLLCEKVPILELSCRPDEDAVCVLSNALYRIEAGANTNS